ncbi:hypothetical protein NC653_035282 [Populus alba x Populus x berolinensis]|uniref:NPR1/NIM1-like C-terminal domain-containing protein n=1 Tax=Populus alba x Populus x berolinensis TaxID=444605 RepID=A0AAD6LQR3_9ROSI|nr:hypothetical protein NC653_035282 [Populus alba x Populus x berolinensis]
MKTEIFYMASDAHKVAFARLFFPTEVKLAMDIGHAATTPEFAGLGASKVEMGRRYFPNCSEVLDKFMEDDLPDLFYHEKGTPDEQRIKKTRFMELKEDVQRAFTKKQKTMNIVFCLGKTKNYEC